MKRRPIPRNSCGACRRASNTRRRFVYSDFHNGAGWSSLVARRAHNPKVVGSNPTPATNETLWYPTFQRVFSWLGKPRKGDWCPNWCHQRGSCHRSATDGRGSLSGQNSRSTPGTTRTCNLRIRRLAPDLPPLTTVPRCCCHVRDSPYHGHHCPPASPPFPVPHGDTMAKQSVDLGFRIPQRRPESVVVVNEWIVPRRRT
jgi:hypothetical protein